MKKAVWLRPEAVAQIEFLEWTADRLRHSKFVGLREDKEARNVIKGTVWGIVIEFNARDVQRLGSTPSAGLRPGALAGCRLRHSALASSSSVT
jgi:hypothetical protein